MKDTVLPYIVGTEVHRVQWTKNQAARAMGCLVYIFWGENDHPLYVGRSSKGLGRPLGSGHPQQAVLAKASRVEFICVKDIVTAERIEKALIRGLMPDHNISGIHERRYPGKQKYRGRLKAETIAPERRPLRPLEGRWPAIP